MSLFQFGQFKLHSGQGSSWKIDCDALTPEDWAALAQMTVQLIPEFGSVEGVPRGGLAFAEALRPFVSSGPLLIVDDVMTTGVSMEVHRRGREARGVVVFARGNTPAPPNWVRPLFTAEPWLG